MNDEKYRNIEIAKSVWKLYHSGMDKSAISKNLSINRAEVTHIIKYTTQVQYLKNTESENIVHTLLEEKETLLKKSHQWKYSDIAAYQNNVPTGEKLTYKRLVEIYTDDIKRLKKESSDIREKHKKFKKWYWLFFSVMLFLIFLAGGYLKGYFMKTQNYHQIDISSSWESQEGDTLYRLIKED
jgi:hypothetical protein